MSAEAKTANPKLAKKAAKTIYNYIIKKTEGVELEEYEEINAEMATTQICGLSGIHRSTWYDNGVVYELVQEFESISYEPGNPIRIDAIQFLEEYNA